jgi:hypothetical protein
VGRKRGYAVGELAPGPLPAAHRLPSQAIFTPIPPSLFTSLFAVALNPYLLPLAVSFFFSDPPVRR